jgi:hypothetical protein
MRPAQSPICGVRLSPGPLFAPCKAQRLIEKLQNGCCRDRILACRKLGNRFCVDCYTDPEVLDALIMALQSDASWEVRREAAFAIRRQDAGTDAAVLAVYLASRLDPVLEVRQYSAEAVNTLTEGRRPAYHDAFATVDAAVAQLQKLYHPGLPDFHNRFVQFAAKGLNIAHEPPPAPPPARAPVDKTPTEELTGLDGAPLTASQN